MKSIVGNEVKVKAAGGVRTPEDLDEMLRIGADRIGTSAGIALISGENSKGGY